MTTSRNNAESSVATAADGASSAAVAVNSGASVPGSVSSGNATSLVMVTCASSFTHHGHSFGTFYSFRAHPRVAQCLQMFAFVELHDVHAFVWQTRASPTDEQSEVQHLRLGIAPRTTPTTIQTGKRGKNGTDESQGVVDMIPHLLSFTTGTIMPTSASFHWGKGGAPFPPGLQLDFRAAETRFPYAQFVIGSTHPGAAAEKPLVGVQLTIILACRGSNFGLVHSN